MRFPLFEMERMQSLHEHRVRYDLSESGVEALALEEVAGDLASLGRTMLGYAEGRGREETRRLVALIHRGASADDVLLTAGTSEANYLALASLLEPGDECVVVMPQYMQAHGVARGLGARVREVWLREERGWRLDLDALVASIGSRTKVISVCQPNNPTGQILGEHEIREIVRAADRSGAWILADEVYRGAERDGAESPSFAGRGPRVLVTGGLSKVYGLAGLRIGWLVAPPERIAAAERLKDYLTIAPATISELLAERALLRRAALVKRARFLVGERWPILAEWAGSHRDRLSWTPPAAGAVCFFAYSWTVDSVPLVERLIAERSAMVVPGQYFRAERHLRIGFGMAPHVLRAGLAALDLILKDVAGPQ